MSNQTSATGRRGKPSLKVLVVCSFLAAISIVLTRYGSIMLAGGSIRLGFGNLPIVFAGLLLGPFAGGLTGLVGDLLGFVMAPQGTFHPGFTISSVLTGVIPGMVARYGGGDRFSPRVVITACVLVYLLIGLGLNTLWLTHLLGQAFLVLLPARAVSQGIVTAITIMILLFLSRYSKQWEI